MKILTLIILLFSVSHAGAIKPLSDITATASSEDPRFPVANAADGGISDKSRWISAKRQSGDVWLQLEWKTVTPLQGIHLFSGAGSKDSVRGLEVEYRTPQGAWAAIPSAVIQRNTLTALSIPFDTTVDVATNALRLTFTDTHDGRARIKEVIVWPESAEGMPPISADSSSSSVIPKIYLNQSGFNLGKPKRFTAPTLPDGTPFSIHPSAGGDALFTGAIRANIGDFSAFDPEKPGEYVVKAKGETSVPFSMDRWHFERVTYQASIDFMIDSRHYVGNHTKPCRGSFGWRDDHAFAWALRTLVPQLLSNPAAYERMPKQVSYASPQPGLWGALEPYGKDAPDIVKLIHWGADVTVTQGTTHEFFKGELAYFLYAWPLLKEWLPQQNYDAVLKFVRENWEKEEADREYPYDVSPEHNLFALKTTMGDTKGNLPPGHSVLPNLLMHEVAKRDGLPDSEKYFDAAHKQVAWMIDNLDWEDPLTTKGQRMSEHITMTGLAAFLQLYPDRAPQGLKEKIQEWAQVMIRRSDNLWDFRKLTDDGDWVPSGEKRTMWNEPGNVVGFPAALLAAAPFVNEPTQKRLQELAWSHLDNAFGRNPTGRHFSYDAPREVAGVEHGWYSYNKGGIGQLAEARFVLDASPKHVHYPYNPQEGNYGWVEGWVNFNTAFNLSLAYLARQDITIEMRQTSDAIAVRLHAPISFDNSDNPIVRMKLSGKKDVDVHLERTSATDPTFRGVVPLRKLGVSPGDTVTCSYGYGYMQTSTTINLN
jgi:hypothetical protein